jgi:hypothetical protein
MSSRPPLPFKVSPVEPQAEALLAVALPGATFDHRDVPPAQGMHDFDMRLPHGVTVAVEVTSVTDPRLMTALSTLHDPKGPITAQSIDGHGRLRWSWSVMPTADTNLKSLASGVVELLAAIEAGAGGSAPAPWYVHGDPFDSPLRRRLHEDFRLAAAMPRPRPPGMTSARVDVWSPQHHRVWGESAGEHVVRAVDVLAAKDDNVRKLAAADAAERHLFVWIDPRSSLEWIDMAHEVLPIRPPQLPAVIDAVWTGTAGPADLLWRYDRECGWQTVVSHPQNG